MIILIQSVTIQFSRLFFFFFLTNFVLDVTEQCYYKVCQVYSGVIDCYYKLRQVPQNVTDFIRRCVRYYNV